MRQWERNFHTSLASTQSRVNKLATMKPPFTINPDKRHFLFSQETGNEAVKVEDLSFTATVPLTRTELDRVVCGLITFNNHSLVDGGTRNRPLRPISVEVEWWRGVRGQQHKLGGETRHLLRLTWNCHVLYIWRCCE